MVNIRCDPDFVPASANSTVTSILIRLSLFQTTAGELLRYQISLATEAVMDVLTNEQAERFGLPAVVVFIAGCGADLHKGSIYTIMLRSHGRPDQNLLRTACRILIPMEEDEGFLCKAAGALHQCRTSHWLLEIAPILKEKLGPDLYERVLIQGFIFASDNKELELLEVLPLIEPELEAKWVCAFSRRSSGGSNREMSCMP